jgi:hypothetical protein
MANDVSARPWFIDTAGATVIWPYQCYIKFIEVVGATAGTVGNVMAELTDKVSKSIITAKYQTAALGEIQTYNVENWFNGFIVPTLGTGVTLRVHVK